MSSYPNRYIKGKPDTHPDLALSSKIDIKDIIKYSAVTLGLNGWVYTNNLEMVHGSLYGVSSGYLQICVYGQFIKFKNSVPFPIDIGVPIIGGVRFVDGVTKYGYVSQGTHLPNTAPYTPTNFNNSINALSRVRGVVVDGGKINTINQDSPADVLVCLSYGD